MQEFIDNLKDAVEIFEEIEMSDDTDFKSVHDWDSIALISIMASISSNYYITLTAEEILESKTVSDLWNLVQTKKEELI